MIINTTSDLIKELKTFTKIEYKFVEFQPKFLYFHLWGDSQNKGFLLNFEKMTYREAENCLKIIKKVVLNHKSKGSCFDLIHHYNSFKLVNISFQIDLYDDLYLYLKVMGSKQLESVLHLKSNQNMTTVWHNMEKLA